MWSLLLSKGLVAFVFNRHGNIFPYFISDTRPVPRTPSAAGDDEDDSITDSSFFLEKFQMAFKASALEVMKQAFADINLRTSLPSIWANVNISYFEKMWNTMIILKYVALHIVEGQLGL